jgi:hypothetical protein
MSKKKSVQIFDRSAWFWDNSLDVVLAHLVEVAVQEGHAVDDARLDDWRVCASVHDLAFAYPKENDIEPTLMMQLLQSARNRIVAGGDLHRRDLVDWSVFPDIAVSGGYLRTEVLSVEAMLDAVDGLIAMVSRTLAPDPPGGWFFGLPDGRRNANQSGRGPRGG